MNRPSNSKAAGTRLPKLVLLVSLIAVFSAWQAPLTSGSPLQSAAPQQRPPKITANTVLVGAQACAECHTSIVKAQAQSSMGRALEHTNEAAILKRHERLTFRAGGYAYEIVREGGQSIYRVTDGRDTFSVPISYSFGQGKAGQTYVFKYDGAYYESRVSYYQEIDGLDFTFGRELKRMNSLEEAAGVRMDEGDTQRCFGCHTTGAVRERKLHFDKLIPGISCEACHGPGSEHVAAMKAGQAKEAKIFNPGKLGGDELTQAFCANCHRSVEDVLAMQRQGSVMSVRFQPYRIYNSKCYSGDSRISCVACHDPHRDARQDAAFYDAKCLACHAAAAKNDAPVPQCKVGTKDCASCHMPKTELTGSHFKFTDHWIRVAKKDG